MITFSMSHILKYNFRYFAPFQRHKTQLLLLYNSGELYIFIMKTVERLLADKLVAVDQALMGVVGVPLGLHLAGPLGVGQQTDRRAEDVGEAVQLALGQVVAAANQR